MEENTVLYVVQYLTKDLKGDNEWRDEMSFDYLVDAEGFATQLEKDYNCLFRIIRRIKTVTETFVKGCLD